MSKKSKGLKGRVALALFAVVLAGVAAVLVWGGGAPAKKATETNELATSAAFKPYKLEAKEAEPVKEPKSGVPEGFQEPEGDGEVVVIEESHEPAAAVAAKAPEGIVPMRAPVPVVMKQEPLTLDRTMRQRYGTRKQQQLLRKMNEDLEAGRIKKFDTTTIMTGRSRRISGEDGKARVKRRFGPMPTIQERLRELGIKNKK